MAALTALRAWARQRDQMPEQRAVLLSAAWRAGERNVRELARIADVSRQTVYDDLRAQGIDPRADRGAAVAPPRYAPLNYRQVADLAERMATVLGPAMLASDPEPLADAAWMAHKAIYAIAQVLNPELPAGDRTDWLDTITDCANRIRRAAHRRWASEATDDTEIAQFTENAAITGAELGEAALVADATLTVLLPDGTGKVQVAMTTAGLRDAEPEGWMKWTSDSPLPLAPIDRVRHLEIHSLLTSLSEVITQALDPDLLEAR
ncbi:aminotransferase-like domain-containing protein [Amycolatopsis thermoflava]|uniref:hypothetical protein n=1 Tax=Amycolatopsis thermoflava TaxID=84480 RepID=UPI003657796B